MTRTLPLLALAAAAALAGCNNEDHTLVGGHGVDDASAVANAGEVTLPPSIAASRSYRCKDNSLVYVDWLSDGTARVKANRNEVGTPANPTDEASPLKGDAQAPAITYNGQSCKA